LDQRGIASRSSQGALASRQNVTIPARRQATMNQKTFPITHGAPRDAGQAMSPAQARFVFLEQGAGAAVGNFVVNGLIGWAAYRSLSVVPLWGAKGIAADAIVTSFLLPLITCFILHVVVKKQVKSGTLDALPASWRARSGFAWLPRNVALRGLSLWLFSAVALTAPTVGVLIAMQVGSLSLHQFLLFKALHAMTLAVLTSPVAAVYALASAPSRRA
jgi:hypothetical protein